MCFVWLYGYRYKKHPHFKRFLDLCSKSYKVLRQQASVLEILFVLMASAGRGPHANIAIYILLLLLPRRQLSDHALLIH